MLGFRVEVHLPEIIRRGSKGELPVDSMDVDDETLASHLTESRVATSQAPILHTEEGRLYRTAESPSEEDKIEAKSRRGRKGTQLSDDGSRETAATQSPRRTAHALLEESPPITSSSAKRSSFLCR